MALSSPSTVLAMPAMFGQIRPALNILKKLGFSDFSADAPSFDIKPGATVKVPIASVTAANAYNASSNNYATGGTTDWATLSATHYLQGFDISGVNVDEGVDAAKMQQIFTARAGKAIAAACMTNAVAAIDDCTASTAVVLTAITTGESATAPDATEYQKLASSVSWLNRATSVLALNGAEYANLKAAFAAINVVAKDDDLAAFIGFGGLVCLPGMTARAAIVPDGAVGFLGRVPTLVCTYRDSGVQTDDESGLSVGIVINEDKDCNRIIASADLWFGTAKLSANAGATTQGVIKVGTAS